ncbi:hypothetical protein A9Q99_07035 [Gammaproteobacteria bacterium 45_16_T64]|nr:hypothetical protein A9Q99_07035 [Gammaproteobacteria bacterium 45_16_T64]
MKIEVFEENTCGADFVCSDIHGHFSLLERQLEAVKFNKSVDRLFCLGDLIDRGDESHRVIHYLSQPWFHSILGNHELMLIDAFESESEHVRRQWGYWGGDWADDLDEDQLQQYYDVLVTLPMAIELAVSSTQVVGLVHAELPMICDWRDVKRELENKPSADNLTNTALLHGMMWNKNQMRSAEAIRGVLPAVENIDHVFHGHTILNEITTVSNRTFLDLGSYETGVIGLISPLDYIEG